MRRGQWRGGKAEIGRRLWSYVEVVMGKGYWRAGEAEIVNISVRKKRWRWKDGV